MNKNISFCISTAKNELKYIQLLFKSLQYNLSTLDHEIIVFIDSDNQGTFEWLKTQKQIFPNLKILKNPLPLVFGACNIGKMFQMSSNDIVSHLQSDMIICKNYDLEILKYIEENVIISSTRIEPPLHPQSPEKHTFNLGLIPEEFDFENFIRLSESLKKDKQTDFWFAPYTLYKEKFLECGGYDSLFQRSRSDSDVLYRLGMCGQKTVQIWNALVYHFTCTSSRGIEWWKQENQERTKLQQIADCIDLQRFLRKWPTFKHSSHFDPDKEYKYNISINLFNGDQNYQDILQNYHLFYKIYIENKDCRNLIKENFEKLQDPANQLLGINDQIWKEYKKYYRIWNSDDIFADNPIVDEDIIINANLKGKSFNQFFTDKLILGQLNDIIHNSQNEEAGEFELDKFSIKINKIVNRIQENIIIKNPIEEIDIPIL